MSDYLYIIKGDLMQFTSTVTLAGQPVDLSLADIYLSFYQRDFYEQELARVTSMNGLIVADGNNGNELIITMSPDFTANIPECAAADWFLRMRAPFDQVYTLNRGMAAIVPGLPPLDV